MKIQRDQASTTGQRRPPGPRMRQVPAVTRGVAILRLLSKRDEPLGLNAVARELGLVPSTCLHILRALVADELVAFDPGTKKYSLDVGILPLARRVMRRNAFAQAVQPWLDRLSKRYRVTTAGVQVIGLEHIVVVAVSHSELPLRLNVDIGSRFPALISATGRCLAAFGGCPQDELERRFRTLRWDLAPTLKEWRREIGTTRRSGYSIDKGNYIRGVTIVSAPVLNRLGRMSHGVVAIGVGEQMKHDGFTALAENLLSAANAMSEY